VFGLIFLAKLCSAFKYRGDKAKKYDSDIKEDLCRFKTLLLDINYIFK